MDTILCPLHELGHGFSEASGDARTGVSYSIYELENYREVYTVYIQEGECEAMTGKSGESRTVTDSVATAQLIVSRLWFHQLMSQFRSQRLMQRPMRDLAWPQQPASLARVVQWQRPVRRVSCTVFACQLFDLFTTPSLGQHFQPHLTYRCRQYLAYLLEFYCLEGYVPLLNCWYPTSWSCGFHTPHLSTTLNSAGPKGYELQGRRMRSRRMAEVSVVMMTALSTQQHERC